MLMEGSVGFLVTSLLDKSHLHSAFSGDSWGSDGPAAWRARVVMFIGVALMAGGLAGSLVSSHIPLAYPIAVRNLTFILAVDGVDLEILYPGLPRIPLLWRCQRGHECRDHDLVSRSQPMLTCIGNLNHSTQGDDLVDIAEWE